MTERTRIVSVAPGTPGRRQQKPRTIEIDRDTGSRCFAERRHDLGILELIHLGDDSRRAPGALILRFAGNQFDEAFAHARRRDQQFVEMRRYGVARQMMEQVDDVGRQCRIAGQQADVRVQARRAYVIVAGADVRVAAQTGCLLANDERDLGMCLQVHVADGHVRAGALQFRRPVQVALFVEARLQLDDARDLLAGFGGLDQASARTACRRPRDTRSS